MQNTNLENYINSIIIKTFGSSVKINLPDAMQKLLSGQTELQSKEGDENMAIKNTSSIPTFGKVNVLHLRLVVLF